MSQVLRSVKNVTKGYSHVQVKVRNATSNDPWGPTGTDMADIAKITFNSTTDFYEVMDMLDKRLNDKGKNWRHVLKSLKVLDYCLHEGSELVVTWARKNIYIIKTLREFIYLDEEGKDVGSSIRNSAKDLTSLILDEERLRAERANRGSWKSRVVGLDEASGAGYDRRDSETPRRKERRRPNGTEDDDLEYRLALEASKNEAEADAARRAQGPSTVETDDDLAKALKLSREEEELRKRQLEDQNQESLLFDTPAEQVPQPTGFNHGYQQQTAVDWFGNPVQQQQQQPQATGYLNNAYSQNTNFQPQQTGYAGDLQGAYGYQQQASPVPFDQAQYQQQLLQQQNTHNPWAQQMNGQEQQQQQSQSLQDQLMTQPGSNNPWAASQQATSLLAQPTGSNNPFATQRPQTASAYKAPTLSTLQEQKTSNQFDSRPNPIQNFQSSSQQQTLVPPQQQYMQQQKTADPYAARLNNLLATGEGQDTFGNTGDLRIPAQHTAPGTFVNSAGAGSFGRLEAARTGNNPFYTSAPQQFPSQTGLVPGYGGSNPFGARPAQQEQKGSLIDL